MTNIRCFKVTQIKNKNGNRITKIYDYNSNKTFKSVSKNTDDKKEIALQVLKNNQIEVISYFERDDELFLLTNDFYNDIINGL